MDYLTDFRRRKIQGDNKNCGWCQDIADDLICDINDLGYSATVDQETGVISVYLNKELVVQRKVNYCPMCGRRIGTYV